MTRLTLAMSSLSIPEEEKSVAIGADKWPTVISFRGYVEMANVANGTDFYGACGIWRFGSNYHCDSGAEHSLFGEQIA